MEKAGLPQLRCRLAGVRSCPVEPGRVAAGEGAVLSLSGHWYHGSGGGGSRSGLPAPMAASARCRPGMARGGPVQPSGRRGRSHTAQPLQVGFLQLLGPRPGAGQRWSVGGWNVTCYDSVAGPGCHSLGGTTALRRPMDREAGALETRVRVRDTALSLW